MAEGNNKAIQAQAKTTPKKCFISIHCMLKLHGGL
jgi:hypothetical protein